jgi:PB1 domain
MVSVGVGVVFYMVCVYFSPWCFADRCVSLFFGSPCLLCALLFSTYKRDVQKLRISKTCSLKRLKRKIKGEFGRHMNLKYRDEDGDRISLRKDRHLRTAIKSLGPSNTLRITCTPAKNRSAKASERELKLLDSMVVGSWCCGSRVCLSAHRVLCVVLSPSAAVLC